MFDRLRDLKKAAVQYQIEKVDAPGPGDEKEARARLYWHEYHPYTGQQVELIEEMSIAELQAHRDSLQARLDAIDEALAAVGGAGATAKGNH